LTPTVGGSQTVRKTQVKFFAGFPMAQQSRPQGVQPKPHAVHEIVQHALRSAATAATANGAIDALGDALLELERLVGNSSQQTH
jgi:hypothetical protein